MSLNQKGVAHTLVVLGVVVIAAVGFTAYLVSSNKDVETANTSTASQQPPTAINSKADLKKAGQALDNTTIDSSVNPDQLDSDINQL